MQSGVVIGIHIGPKREAPMESVQQAIAVPGRGLGGDRYCLGDGTFSKKQKPGRQLTLIEIEALEALARDCKIDLKPSETRRNVVTRGVALNHLVGREFFAGPVKLRGLELCEPCGHLESLTRPGVRDGLVHRGGLRAEILTGGVIAAGDAIREP